jgi:heme A synthase
LLETLNVFHGFGARLLVAFAVLLGLWGAYSYFRNQRISGGFRSSFLIMAGLTALQGLFGIGTLLAGGSPRQGLLHVVYGAFAMLFLPGAYRYAQIGNDQRREALVLAGASWIVSIAYLRGMFTG